MKKKLRILVILIAVLLVGTVGYYFMPKKFGKNVNPSEVDHINVFDGNTGIQLFQHSSAPLSNFRFIQLRKLELNKIAARWPAKAVVVVVCIILKLIICRKLKP